MNKPISTPVAIIIVLIVFSISIGFILLAYVHWAKEEVVLEKVEDEFTDGDIYESEITLENIDEFTDWAEYATTTPKNIYLRILIPGKITSVVEGSLAGGPNQIFLSQTPTTWISKVAIKEVSANINSDNLLDYLNEDYGYTYSLLDKFSLETIKTPNLREDAIVFIVLSKGDWGEDIPCYSISAAILLSTQELIRIFGPGEQTNKIKGNDTQLKISSFLERKQAIFKEIIQKIQIGFTAE